MWICLYVYFLFRCLQFSWLDHCVFFLYSLNLIFCFVALCVRSPQYYYRTLLFDRFRLERGRDSPMSEIDITHLCGAHPDTNNEKNETTTLMYIGGIHIVHFKSICRCLNMIAAFIQTLYLFHSLIILFFSLIMYISFYFTDKTYFKCCTYTFGCIREKMKWRSEIKRKTERVRQKYTHLSQKFYFVNTKNNQNFLPDFTYLIYNVR